jgi:hypothetical protein
MHLQIDYKTHLRLKNIKAPTAITATPNPTAANLKMLLSFWSSVGSLVFGAAVAGFGSTLLTISIALGLGATIVTGVDTTSGATLA